MRGGWNRRSAITAAARFLAAIVERLPVLLPVLRHARFPGRRFLAASLRADRMPRQEVVVSSGGLRYRLNLRDDVQREIYFGSHARELALIRDLVLPGSVCLDIGANVGAYALQFARWSSPGGRVFAFEPDPQVAARLRDNVRLNSLEHVVQVHEEAVSNVSGSATFFRSAAEHSGWGSLARFRDIAVDALSVRTITLDEFLEAERISTVAVMKVDVEAHEFELLEGARAALSRHVIGAILVEFNGIRLAERGRVFADFVSAFSEHGYRAVRLNLDRIERIRSGRLNPAGICVNFLFAP